MRVLDANMELMLVLIRSLQFLDSRKSFDDEVYLVVGDNQRTGPKRPGNLSECRVSAKRAKVEHERTKGKLRVIPLRPRTFRATSEGGGEPEYMPLCSIEAQIQTESEPTVGSSLFL